MIGLVDDRTRELAVFAGICIVGGNVNKRDGRVRIFVKRRFPGAHKSGYALRSRVVWWLRTGEIIVGTEIDIHHKNEIRSDDRFENLEKLDHIDHSHYHNPKGLTEVECLCRGCGKTFSVPQWRLKESGRGSFCSQECYQTSPKPSSKVAMICECCGAKYRVPPSQTARRRYCSYSCYWTTKRVAKESA